MESIKIKLPEYKTPEEKNKEAHKLATEAFTHRVKYNKWPDWAKDGIVDTGKQN